MKRCIVVPVDFTDIAFNAYCYANELAYAIDAEVHLMHVATGSFDVDKPLEIKAGMTQQEAYIEKLKGFARWHPNDSDQRLHPVKTTFEVAFGNVVKQVLKIAVAKDPFCIVIGTRDKHTLTDKWLGTVSAGVAAAVDCPVLLVPNHSRYESIENIIVACDYHADNYRIIRKIEAFTHLTKAVLHFVHIKSGDEEVFEYLQEDIVHMMKTYGEPTMEIQTATIQDSDVVSGIYDYAATKQAALIVMISQKRNFLERIIHRSMSRKAAINAKLPTMVLHVE